VQPNVISKAQFAREAGVTAGRVSQWIAAGDLSGDALVRDGRAERIDLTAARRQLGERLAVDQRIVGGRGGRGDTLDALQRARLVAVELANDRARLDAAEASGRFVEADAMRREVGRVAGRIVSSIDGAVPDIADALAARFQLPQRDVAHALRTAWSAVRSRLADSTAEAAASLPATTEAAS
jgi:hypothetical protein